MDSQSLIQFAWIIWLALAIIFLVIEIFTLDLTFLMLAIGSVGGLLTSLFGAGVITEIIVAAVVALLLVFLVRPPLLRALRKGGDPTPSNVEALLGIVATALTVFGEEGGTVKLANGETWTARLVQASAATPVVVGDKLVVVAIEGATAVVAPATPPTEGSAS